MDIYRSNEHTIRQVGKSNAYSDQMEALKEMIENKTEPVNSLHAGFASARVALKIIDAVKQQETLKF